MGHFKLLFSILFLGVAFIGQAQIVNIPDPNFKNALLIDSTINSNGDGEIQVSEAEATTDISVNGSFITDLTGVEAFVNITYLDCSANSLTSIDVSSNTVLEIFECNDNQLTNIDISNNPEIYQFECGFNQLTSIDVSNNPTLVLLSMGNNNISQLDVSNNTFFSILECRETTLENLDFSNNSAFFSLICNNNDELTQINLQNGNNENITFEGVFASDFENLPVLETICIDDEDNTALIDEITTQVGHPVIFTEDCTLEISQIAINSTTIYPNPTNGIIYIESFIPIDDIKVYNLQGAHIPVFKNHKSGMLDLSGLNTGVYFVSLTIGDTREVHKIIKK